MLSPDDPVIQAVRADISQVANQTMETLSILTNSMRAALVALDARLTEIEEKLREKSPIETTDTRTEGRDL